MYYYWRKIRPYLLLLMLAGAVYGGVKGWMYYNIDRALREVAVASGGRLDLDYEGIETDLKGAVTVHGMTLTPIGAPQPLRIARAHLSGPSLAFFLWGSRTGDAPPAHLNAQLEGIEIPLDQQVIDAMRRGLPAPVSDTGHGCGVTDDLDPALLRELGFERLTMDLGLTYDYDAGSQRLNADMALDVHQVERVQAGVSLSDVNPEALQGGGMNNLPGFAGMSMSVDVEPEFGNRYLSACARRAGKDVEAFRKALVGETLATLAKAGLQLGPGLTRALEDYHRDWGELRITAEPAKPVNVMALMFSPPENWQRQLGIRAKLNRQEILDLSFTLRPPDPAELAILLGQEPPPSQPRKPQPRYRYVYKPAPLAGLGELIGDEVRLHLSGDQPVRSGILVSLTGGEARVEQRLHGGKITAHVPVKDIERVEVQRVERIPEPAR